MCNDNNTRCVDTLILASTNCYRFWRLTVAALVSKKNKNKKRRSDVSLLWLASLKYIPTATSTYRTDGGERQGRPAICWNNGRFFEENLSYVWQPKDVHLSGVDGEEPYTWINGGKRKGKSGMFYTFINPTHEFGLCAKLERDDALQAALRERPQIVCMRELILQTLSFLHT